jgi:hypothetical protein
MSGSVETNWNHFRKMGRKIGMAVVTSNKSPNSSIATCLLTSRCVRAQLQLKYYIVSYLIFNTV